jgi:hypothetical protein
MIKNDNKNEIKIANSGVHLTIIYLCIPVIPQVRVVVCHGVPKSSTVPVPAVPILEALRVYLYLCETLAMGRVWYRYGNTCSVQAMGHAGMGMVCEF